MTETDSERVSQFSKAPLSERREQLRHHFPELFSDGRPDPRKFEDLLVDESDAEPDHFRFAWAGKEASLRILQMPTRATLKPDPKGSLNWQGTKHLFIEGENLEVLKLLLRPYYGRVKAIYIDPPYNTGKDFVYVDDYSDPLGGYLQKSGQKDEEGNLLTSNPETAGRYHSSWLSMMYPRLFIARQLLREDGILIVSIDDNELANLRLILNEIFGEENFLGTVIWNSTKTVTNTALISVSHTYNLVFARSREYFVKNREDFRLPEPGEGFSNPDDDPRGPWKADPFQVGGIRPNQQYEITNPSTGEVYTPNPGNSWKNELKVFEELVKDNRIVFGKTGEGGPQRKRFLFEAEERGRVAKTLWDDVDTTANATRYLEDLFGKKTFDNPKPVDLIERFLQLSVHEPADAIVMDFFAGSCTTAEAVMRLNMKDGGNRRFIMVQLPEGLEEPAKLDDGTTLRTISEIGQERIRRCIHRIVSEAREDENISDQQVDSQSKKMGFRFYGLSESNTRPWEGVKADEKEEYIKEMADYIDPLVEGWSIDDVITEVAIKEAGLGLLSSWEQLEADSDQTVFRVDGESGGYFYICLDDEVRLDRIDQFGIDAEDLFVCRAAAVDDKVAANLALQCRLKVI